MKKALVLSRNDARLLTDILDYFMRLDDREKNDFIEHYGLDAFNEYDILDHNKVGHLGSSHIYYKLSLLEKSLLEAENE
jgi:hypothetical protein